MPAVDLLIGSRPLIVGMNHHFSWHAFYTKFPSSVSSVIDGAALQTLLFLVMRNKVLLIFSSCRALWTTFLEYVFLFPVIQRVLLFYLCVITRKNVGIHLNVYSIVDGSFYWSIHCDIKNMEWSLIIDIQSVCLWMILYYSIIVWQAVS